MKKRVKVVKCTFYAVYEDWALGEDKHQLNLEKESALSLLDGCPLPVESITAEIKIDGEIEVEGLWDGLESDDTLNYFSTEQALKDYVDKK